ncbi:phosphodiester glycosidase family protein [Pararhodobacter sp. SW119]|uniref:phosphodiester glycosidase family protein n=1 Tax=Pararhodobacter sp. SW119 TaxID=2780075 RepID=UPI001AE0B877|nr:phosphodiester glycosidase family protein [Pararhodobacter sp. SW119]
MIRAAEALAAVLALAPVPAIGQCAQLVHEAIPYTICETAAGDDLRLFLTDADGAPFGTFARIEAALAAQGLALGFAMNAGMYHPDRRPVGLYVEAGETRARLITSEGPGNFGMLPNGVFCIGAAGFSVIESRTFADTAPPCDYATQSGPMLVIDGALHPRFLPDSQSRNIRNGVGVSEDGQRAYFAISNQPVTFHEFGGLFRDALRVPQALYFDGNVSRLHAPELGRSDWGRQMGPVVGLVLPLPDAGG